MGIQRLRLQYELSNIAKAFGALVLPLLLALVNVFTQFVLNNDPKRDQGQPLRDMSKWVLPILSILMIPITLFKALGYDIRIEKVIPVLIC
ncbi:MAG: hypothetical protein JEY71_13220 [Sphaerochaeta sp.]|nr:hypothetical protein [Sphaerochaeta sp.]